MHQRDKLEDRQHGQRTQRQRSRADPNGGLAVIASQRNAGNEDCSDDIVQCSMRVEIGGTQEIELIRFIWVIVPRMS